MENCAGETWYRPEHDFETLNFHSEADKHFASLRVGKFIVWLSYQWNPKKPIFISYIYGSWFVFWCRIWCIGCEVLMFRRHIKQHESESSARRDWRRNKRRKIGNIPRRVGSKSSEIRYVAPLQWEHSFYDASTKLAASRPRRLIDKCLSHTGLDGLDPTWQLRWWWVGQSRREKLKRLSQQTTDE